MTRSTLAAALAISSTVVALAASQDDLLRAVRKGDAAAVKALLEQGVPVDAKFRYERTALSFAADRGHVEVVKLLLERGADPNAKDTFYEATPVVWAAGNGHVEVARLLVGRGGDAGQVLSAAVNRRNPEMLEVALASAKLNADDLSAALARAEKAGATEMADRLRKAGAVPPPKADFKVDSATLASYAGRYREKTPAEGAIELSVVDGALQASFMGRPYKLGAFDLVTFRPLDIEGIRLVFKVDSGRVMGLTLKEGRSERWFERALESRP